MGDVIYLSQSDALNMNKFRGTIAWIKKQNTNGQLDESLKYNQSILRSFMDAVLQRPQKVSSSEELAA